MEIFSKPPLVYYSSSQLTSSYEPYSFVMHRGLFMNGAPSLVPWPQAIQISQENIGPPHTQRPTRSEKQFNLRTSKCAKLQNPSPDTEIPVFFLLSNWQ